MLHWLCLYKSRSLAARACRNGRVLLDDERARPSHEVQAGDRITIVNPGGTQMRVVNLLQVPARQTSRKDAAQYYEVLATRKIDLLADPQPRPDAAHEGE